MFTAEKHPRQDRRRSKGGDHDRQHKRMFTSGGGWLGGSEAVGREPAGHVEAFVQQRPNVLGGS